MILTPDFVKNSIENYNNKMNREREQQATLVAKILAASNVIAKAGRQGQGNRIMVGEDYLDRLTKNTTMDELFGYNENFKVYKEPINRIISDVDPYGEENWEN